MSKLKPVIIGVLNRKGGCAKTTSVMHIAQVLKDQGRDVAVLDLDPETTARTWARLADDLGFPVYGAAQQKQALKHAYLVIDTPPNDARVLGEAARLSTHVIVPSGANSLEADRLTLTLTALAASGFSGEAGVLLTRVKVPTLRREAEEGLTALGIPLLGVVPHLAVFERAFGTVPIRLDEHTAALKGLGL